MKETKDEKITFRLTELLRKKIESYSNEKDSTISKVVEEIVKEYFTTKELKVEVQKVELSKSKALAPKPIKVVPKQGAVQIKNNDYKFSFWGVVLLLLILTVTIILSNRPSKRKYGYMLDEGLND
ncbi:hypothetical protein [Lacihabitans lacunae]|uniref:Uncharacterized protein n=1 Tax=Lacihabitans lacunae TaxID=1028214 RepID=A0ABV7YU74_9BACT